MEQAAMREGRRRPSLSPCANVETIQNHAAMREGRRRPSLASAAEHFVHQAKPQ